MITVRIQVECADCGWSAEHSTNDTDEIAWRVDDAETDLREHRRAEHG